MKFAKVALIALVLSCAAGAYAESSNAEALLMSVDGEFSRVTQEKGLDGWMHYFAGNAFIPAKEGPIISGSEDLRKRYARMFATPGFSLVWKPERAEVAGDLGYTVGSYIRKVNGADGKQQTETGRYITIWKKQQDGSWKIVTDMGN